MFTSTVAGSVLLISAGDYNGRGTQSSSDLTYTTFNNGPFPGMSGLAGTKALPSTGAQTANINAAGASPATYWAAVEIVPPMTGEPTPIVLPVVTPDVVATLAAPSPLTGTPAPVVIPLVAPVVSATIGPPLPVTVYAAPAVLPVITPPPVGILGVPTPLNATAAPCIIPVRAMPAAAYIGLPPVNPHHSPTFPPGVAASTADFRWWYTPRPLGSATNTGQSVPSGGWVDVPPTAHGVDRDGAWTASQYNIGTTLGLYEVSGSVTFAASSAGTMRQARIQLNGGAVPGGTATIPVNLVSIAPQTLIIAPTMVVATATTDALTIQCLQDSGTTLTVTGTLNVEYVGDAGQLTAPVGVLTEAGPVAAGASPEPGVPAFGAFSSATYQPSDGYAKASITATWLSLTLNADGSTDNDLDHYEIQYRATGAIDWQQQQAAKDQTRATVTGLSLGTSYDFQIRAVNGSGGTATEGAWSATRTSSSSLDTTPPGQPSVPVVAASLIAVQVTHDLTLAAGGSLPPDMDHLEVHLGATSGFTTSGLTLAGHLKADGAMAVAGISAVGTFKTSSTSTVWVKIVAVDKSGNRSTPSAGASSTATLIDDAHISDLTVTKILAGTISTTWLMAGLMRTAASGARWEIDAAGIRAYDSGGSLGANITSTGGVSFQTASSGDRVTITSGTADRVSFISANGSTSYIGSTNVSVGSKISMVAANGATVYAGRGPTGEIIAALTTSAGQSVAVDNLNGTIITGNAQVTGSLSAGTWNISSLSLSGTLGVTGLSTLTGGATIYGTTTTINPSGACNITASNLTVTIPSGGQAKIGSGNVSGGDTTWIASPNVSIGTGNNSDVILSNSIYNKFITTGSANVVIATTPQGVFYRFTSSARYKVDIQPADDIPLSSILAMEPKTFYDRGQWERNGESTDGLSRGVGVIAEEVNAIPGLGEVLVPKNADGQPESVNYDRVGILLLKVVQDHEARLLALEHA